MTAEVVIVGAGLTGIACARRLAAAGRRPVLLDKGRGIGGRLATRRVEVEGQELSFDHGAPYVDTRTADFTAALAALTDASAIWMDRAAPEHVVGVPGMSELPRALAQGLDIRQGVEATALQELDIGWRVETPHGHHAAQHLVVAVPAPQAKNLLGAGHAFASDLSRVEMAPCLTLMAAFAEAGTSEIVSRRDESHPLAWIGRNDSKPGRSAGAATWVAHASTEWSRRHLEEERPRIAELMLPLLCDLISAAPEAAIYAAGHRWRYARASKPLGRHFLRSADGSLHVGGDWCLGAQAEDAWTSGVAIARSILGEADAG